MKKPLLRLKGLCVGLGALLLLGGCAYTSQEQAMKSQFYNKTPIDNTLYVVFSPSHKISGLNNVPQTLKKYIEQESNIKVLNVANNPDTSFRLDIQSLDALGNDLLHFNVVTKGGDTILPDSQVIVRSLTGLLRGVSREVIRSLEKAYPKIVTANIVDRVRAVVSKHDNDKRFQLTIISRVGDKYPLLSSDNEISMPVVSDDENLVAYIANEDNGMPKLYVQSLNTSKRQALDIKLSQAPESLRFADDKTIEVCKYNGCKSISVSDIQ